MARRETPLPDGPLQQFALALRELRANAPGTPTFRELARGANYSASTLAAAAAGRRLPTLDVTLAFVRACGGDVDEWRDRWMRLHAVLGADRPDLIRDAEVVPLRTFQTDSAVTALTRLTRGDRTVVVAGCEDGSIVSLDLGVGDGLLTRVAEHPGPVWGVAAARVKDDDVIVSVGDAKEIHVFGLGTEARRTLRLTGHTAPINAVATATVGGRLMAVTGADDNTVRRWDVVSGAPVGEPLIGHGSWVNGVALGQVDGRALTVSASADETVRVWDAESGAPIAELTGHTDSVSSVAMATVLDGRVLTVSGCRDADVRVWDLATEQQLSVLPGHVGPVRAVDIAVLAGGPVVLSAGDDGTIWAWDPYAEPARGRVIGLHAGPVRAVTSATLDGRPVAISGGDDGTVRVWALTELAEQVEWQSDAPARVDLLRRRPLAEALGDRLRRVQADEPETSFLVHIDGPWGIGKSSLLNFLRTDLEQDWAAVEFNAWRQSRVGPPWWALLAALRHDIRRGLGGWGRLRLRLAESMIRLNRVGRPFVAAAVVLLIGAAVAFLALRPSHLTLKSAGDASKAVTAVLAVISTFGAGILIAGRFFFWDSARGAKLFEQSDPNPMQSVADHFAWLVGRARRPVIFFIDDLDRCPQSYVVELLDAVQTLIRDASGRPGRGDEAVAPHFVVAADGAWIRKSYEIAYEQFAGTVAEPGRPLGYLFLDKIFQLRVPVPVIDRTGCENYLRELLRLRTASEVAKRLAAEEATVRNDLRRSSSETEILETLRRASPEIRDRVAGAAVERLTTPQVTAATEHSLQRFAALMTPNPRSMKRFVNAYTTLRAVRTLEGNPVRTEPLALWTIVETRWPGLADHLRRRPTDVGLLGGHLDDLADVPAELRDLFRDPAVNKVLTFRHGGPLTAELIQACCGTRPRGSQPSADEPLRPT
ncbi:P-loop NTPase fold protein [Actinoallomurus rhizosphaericola]|uniref:P-loop NTPase fold protein n=1 Tax=Actinoallomurus rhizosphaericola TaxID=2952536 RepID=UPI00209331D9|nr:P-loop NTPase fold protein [Actinoallomurus rhizosphaericola]MCO5995311.1 P-loop NTPase fold protein [Actinoallomurus rhizosphaericola]